MVPPGEETMRRTNATDDAGRASARRTGFQRFFFLMLAGLYAVVAVVGFAPNFRDHFAGTYEIHPVAWVHGAIMTAWLALFLAQTSLVAFGSVKLHRKLGIASLGMAALVWLSMIVASLRQLAAGSFPGDEWLFDLLLLQSVVIVLFTLYCTWGIRARRRPDTHKRLMVFTNVVLLQAAVDRMHWLTDFGLPGHWGMDVRVYALLLPLFVFDLVSLGRIYRTTLICTALLLVGHLVVNWFGGSPAWHGIASAISNAIR